MLHEAPIKNVCDSKTTKCTSQVDYKLPRDSRDNPVADLAGAGNAVTDVAAEATTVSSDAPSVSYSLVGL